MNGEDLSDENYACLSKSTLPVQQAAHIWLERYQGHARFESQIQLLK